MYTIYLIEDDSGIREGIKNLLRGWDMQVIPVADFRNVLTEFSAARPHLVIIDISLPFYDGYHWCREIRKVSEVPILFLSSAAGNKGNDAS